MSISAKENHYPDRRNGFSGIGREHRKNLDMAVGEIDPVVDGKARADSNLDPPTNGVVLVVIGEPVR